MNILDLENERAELALRIDKLIVFLQSSVVDNVTDQRGKTTSIGQSNRISYCPMCGRQLK